MATIVSTLFISLDGVTEVDPEWHFPYYDEHMANAVDEDYQEADVLLLGRATWDSFVGAWPDREDAGEEDAPFARRLGDTRKVVVSRGTGELGWRNAQRLEGDLVEAVTALKADPGTRRILVPGSISVVRQLLDAGLLDELRLLVHPVAARRGKRLFDEGDARYPLELLRSEVFPSGVVRLIYAPTAAPAPAGYDDVKATVPSSAG
ncbi:dihydrofolate reductase family protein [Georgenia faecalis]|uniref:Dihydrofolate reductase family protein n=1 Tax=Georgenia faecalis TaxID=2483799 RepID=A0ABV9DDC8_9MICO|nr:dihydrofolate reductase family protein [Georgenia faecalis]